MNRPIRDNAVHPLVPGSLLACIMGDPQSWRTQSLDATTFASFDKSTTLDIVSQFQQLELLSNEQATKVIDADSRFVSAFQELMRKIPEVAQVTGCDRGSVEQLARTLFSAKLMAEYLEIVTPPQLSY